MSYEKYKVWIADSGHLRPRTGGLLFGRFDTEPHPAGKHRDTNGFSFARGIEPDRSDD